MLGDFNAIKDDSERRGSTENIRRDEMEAFDDFIVASKLLDLPLLGRRFTLSRLGGSAMSRLDRFLISEAWFRTWPASTQWCLLKELSYHCPIMSCESIQN